MEDFLACHMHAFRFFGGVPKNILYDNLKTVVLSRLGKTIRFNPKFLDFAGALLFEPVPCKIRAGWEKGEVESSIRYIRLSFLAGLLAADLHAQAHVAKIMGFAVLYGKTEVLQALTHALAHTAFGAPYIQNIVLQQRARRGLADTPPIHVPAKPQWTQLTVEEQDLALYDDLFQGDSHAPQIP